MMARTGISGVSDGPSDFERLDRSRSHRKLAIVAAMTAALLASLSYRFR